MIPPLPLDDLALFLDVDGTLIDIALRPDAVAVPTDLVSDLEQMNQRLGGALALISGRAIADLDSLFVPLKLRASGVHGAEYRFDPHQGSPLTGARPLSSALWTDVLELIAGFPGTMAENKVYSYAVHYRLAQMFRDPLHAALEKLVAEEGGPDIRLMPGHAVFELKRADFNKGMAVEAFLKRAEFDGRRPVFVGDDVTDWPGFTAAVRAGGLAYSVGATAPGVMGTFENPQAVRHWLKQTTHSETVTA